MTLSSPTENIRKPYGKGKGLLGVNVLSSIVQIVTRYQHYSKMVLISKSGNLLSWRIQPYVNKQNTKSSHIST